MTRNKKIGLWTAGIIGSVLLLLAVAIVALPLLADRERVRDKVRSTLSRVAGGEIDFTSVQASFLPPGAKLSEVRVALPDISGTAESIDAGFDLSRLLRGELAIDDIAIENPNFSISLPEPSDTEETNEAWTAERIRKKVEELLSRMGQNMPNGTITVIDGTLLLTRKGETLYSFKELNARADLPPEALRLNLATSSNVWDTLTFEGKIDADGTDAAGELKIQELRPEPIAGYFAPGTLKDFESARVSLEVDFHSPDLESIKGNLRGSAVHEKIPYPVEIAESAFAFGGKGLFLNDFGIRAGESHAGASWVRLRLGDEKNLVIESAAAELRMGRIFPWAIPLLSRIEGVEEIAEDYEEVKGDFSFFSVELRGPLDNPREWKFEGEGTAENVVVETENLPAPVMLKRADFKGDRTRMDFDLRQLGFMGSSLALSGSVYHPLSSAATVDAAIGGDLGPETVAWLSERFQSPDSAIRVVQGAVTIAELNLSGPVSKLGELSYQGIGEVRDVALETGHVPGVVAIPRGGFAIGPETISLSDVRADLLDSSFDVSGDIDGYAEGLSSADLTFQGVFSEKTAAWLKEKELIPSWLNIPAPVAASEGIVAWGREKETEFSADLAMEGGPRIGLSLLKGPERLNIEKLVVQDSRTQASISMTLGDDILDLDFNGNVDGETLGKLIAAEQDLGGWIRGNFSLRAPMKSPMQTRVQGTILAGGIDYAGDLKAPLRVRELSLQGQGDRIRIDSADLVWRETDIGLNGSVGFSEKGIVLDIVASTEGFEWEKAERIVEEEAGEETAETTEKEEAAEQESVFGDLPLEGKAVLKADYFKYGDIMWEPFHMTVDLRGNRVALEFAEGALCGVRTEASARVSPEPLRIEAEAEAQDKKLGETLECFLETKVMSGEFDLAGEITTRGKPANLADNLQGQFNFTAENGRIFRFGLLAKILAVVNITEILKFRAPDLAGDGFGYRSIRASGVIENGILTLNETYIEGRSVDLAFVGTLDIAEKQVDLTVLVTPLKTVDSIIESIPIIGHIAGENFMAIPVRVRGDLSDPRVTPMSPSSVGRGLLGIVKRTLQLPVRVVQPFLPEQKKRKR